MNDLTSTLTLRLDASLYSAQAAQRAAFRLDESFGAEIWRGDGVLEVTLTPRKNTQTFDRDVVIEIFRRAVLDEQLREQVFEQTREIRQSLIDAAFRSVAAKRRPAGDS